MVFRKYFIVVIIISLLIWGPINNSWSGWLVIRLGYLILIPTIVWFLLGGIWNKWQLSTKLDNALVRILSSLNCVALLIMAFFETQRETHFENTKWVRTYDGMEAVGEDIMVKGPDWGNAFILIILVALIFWFGVLKKNFQSSDY
jgi:hypothetical protein